MKICFLSLPKNIAENKLLQSAFKTPPITYLWLSSILKANGHSVSIVDALSLQLNEKEILQAIKHEEPDLVGFTVYTSGVYDALYLAKHLKENFPKIRIAVGGYHVNSRPLDLCSDYIDYIFVGETEYSLLELMNRLDKDNESMEGILGLIYHNSKNGEWITNPPAGFREDFDNQPILPYEMILNNRYNAWWTLVNPKSHRYMATITGRGCPMRCSFCDISKTEGVRYRGMSAERVLEEISYMNIKLGITHIEFRDASLASDVKRLTKIAEGILEKGLKIEWECNGTIKDIKDRGYLDLLYDAGCRFLFFGVESGNPDILKREKKVTPQKVYEVVEMTQQAGIHPHCSFIFGLEGETEEGMKQTIDLALGLKCYTASFSIAAPYPGTKLYNSYKEKGYIKTFDWKLYDAQGVVFETEKVSQDMLKSYLEKAHKKFYFRFSYIWERLKGIRSYHELKTYIILAFKMMFDVVVYKR